METPAVPIIKERLKKLLQWKAEVLQIPELAADWVLEWIDELPDKKAKQIYTDMLGYIEEELCGEVVNDAYMCPFCMDTDHLSCLMCPFAKHYGSCGEYLSLYRTSLRKLDSAYYSSYLIKQGIPVKTVVLSILKKGEIPNDNQTS